MKQFKPTYLYVKTHNKTGLKYFGKTSRNPISYRGSGTYWNRHLKIYGNDVDTEVLGYFTDQEECTKFSLNFSKTYSIVECKNWANLMVEDGSSGGDTESGRSEESKIASKEKRKSTFAKKSLEELEEIQRKNSQSVSRFILENPQKRKESAKKAVEKRKSKDIPWHSEETREKIKENNKSGTQEVKNKISKTLQGRENPEQRLRMLGKVGKECVNTRIFSVSTHPGQEIEIIGCAALREFCKNHNLAYNTLIENVNLGRISKIIRQRPRREMLNVIGIEIKETK